MPKSNSAAEMPISQGRNGSSATPTPATPAAAAKPSGKQHAMHDSALMAAATGASFSPCFTYSAGAWNVPMKPLRRKRTLHVSFSPSP